MKKFSILLIAIALFTACSKKENNKFLVTGELVGVTDCQLFVQKMVNGATETFDTIDVKGGKFSFEGETKTPELIIIKLNEEKPEARFFVEVTDKEPIKLTAHIDSLDQAQISGSKTQDQYNAFLRGMVDFQKQSNDIYKLYNKAEADGNTAELAKYEKMWDSLDGAQKNYMLNYVTENKNTPVSAYITFKNLAYQIELPELEKITSSFSDSIKESPYVVLLKERIDVLKKVQIGQPAPDFAMGDTLGNQFAMSSLKGKYLLIDFWASWCRPCRIENPNVVKLFNQFKDKGFTVLGVSLDEERDNWIKAIKDDKLAWNHVSDLKGWKNVVAKQYGVRSIPQTFLLDKNGIIIGHNLRGDELLKKLQEVLK